MTSPEPGPSIDELYARAARSLERSWRRRYNRDLASGRRGLLALVGMASATAWGAVFVDAVLL